MSSAAGSSSLSSRVLSIPELLEFVFQYLDRASNVSNACVCKTWSSIALDTIWREVTDIRRLFSLLAPMITTLEFDFERPVTPTDWSRFSQYARRVRRFEYCDYNARSFISMTALEEVAQTRTTLSILPNLRDLTWLPVFPSYRRFSVLFMNENVRSFTFRVDIEEFIPCQPFFQEIAARMPHLTQLDMRTSHAALDIEPDFLKLINGLPRLQKIILPVFHITSEVMTELSNLDDLGVIQFEFDPNQGGGRKEDLTFFNPTHSEGAFPALWDLSLSAHLTQFTSYIKGLYAPKNLTSIYVHAISVDGEASVQQFFSAIAEQCPLVNALYLGCLPGSAINSQWDFSVPQFEPLTLATLKPLFDCSKLTTLEIMYPVPLALTQQDLEELSMKWPSIEDLSLNEEPVLDATTRSPLTLRALLPFARNCPKLRKLGLFINGTAADIPSPSEIPGPFTRLTELDFGVSSIAEIGPVSLFLSRICPVGCKIMAGVSWPYAEVDSPLTPESAKIMANWCGLWLEVGKYLPLLTRLRMEEMETRRQLQEEVEDLRTRISILMEKAQLALNGDGDESCIIV